jgi:nuclear pore complex protein Nup93
LDAYLRHAHDLAILAAVEEAKRHASAHLRVAAAEQMAADWAQCKRALCAALAPPPQRADGELDVDNGGDLLGQAGMPTGVVGGGGAMSRAALLYADAVTAHNEALRERRHVSLGPELADGADSAAPRPLVASLAAAAAAGETDDAYRRADCAEAFAIVRALVGERDKAAPNPREYVAAHAQSINGSERLQRAHRVAAVLHLEQQYAEFARICVGENAVLAQVGAAPSMAACIGGLVRVLRQKPQFPSASAAPDAPQVDGEPLWPQLYYALRCGAADVALDLAQRARGVVLEDALSLIQHRAARQTQLAKERNAVGVLHLGDLAPIDVRPNMRQSLGERIHTERQRLNSCPFRVAVLNLLVKFDASLVDGYVLSSAQDFLWFKLSMIEESPPAAAASSSSLAAGGYRLTHLQRTLLEYGGEHFGAGGRAPYNYFHVLLLSQQFERAVSYLRSLSGYEVDAVHFAVALHHYGLLRAPPGGHADPRLDAAPVWVAGDEATPATFNFVRLVRDYAASFEDTAPNDSLQYLYLIDNDDRLSPPSLARHTAIAAQLLRAHDYADLVGQSGADGERVPGLLDRFLTPASIKHIASLAARVAAEQGRTFEALALYDVCGDATRVLQLLSDELARLLPTTGAERARVINWAWAAHSKYANRQHASADESSAVAFEQMLRLVEFFELYRAANWPDALRSIEQHGLLPLELVHVSEASEQFRTLADCVRANFGDYLLASMRVLAELFEQAKFATQSGVAGAASQLGTLREAARALVAFSGTIDFDMPGETHARLVRMEASF